MVPGNPNIPYNTINNIGVVEEPANLLMPDEFKQISDSNGVSAYLVDQSTTKGAWVDLGTYHYQAGQTGSVYLDDVVPEAPDARWVEIGVDAVVWLPPGTTWNPGRQLIPYNREWAELGQRTWGGVAAQGSRSRQRWATSTRSIRICLCRGAGCPSPSCAPTARWIRAKAHLVAAGASPMICV
jgi:hypothetical protein